MKVAIDVSPLKGGHSVRGVGFYLRNLLESLKTYAPEHTYLEFTNLKIPPNCDIVHYPYFDPFFLTLPFRLAKPTVITIHDLTPLKFPKLFPPGKKGMMKWQIQKILAQKASAIITDSQNSKLDIHQLLRIPEKKIHVVYLAAASHFTPQKLTTDQKREMQQRYNLPDKFVLYVGDATANKNLEVLLDAIEIAKTPLVMVGKALASDEYDKSNLWNESLMKVQKRAKDNPLIQIVGFVPDSDLVMLYTMASVFVMPSFYEGFGLPLVEAMSCGTPAITTQVSSLPEVGGDAVLYADASDPQDFAEKITLLIKDKELTQEMREKGLLQAKKFSWENTAKATVKVYESLL